MFFYFSLLLSCLIFAVYVVWLPISWPKRLLVTLAATLASSRLYLLRQIFGGLAAQEAPKALLTATSWAQNTVVVLLTLAATRLLIFGLVRAAAPLAGPAAKAQLLTVGQAVMSGRTSLGLLIAAALLGWYGLHEAAKVPAVNRHEVRLQGWPTALDGLKVAVLADLHISPFFDRPWVASVVERTMAEKPDIILLPGDIVDGSASARHDDIEPLSGLQAPYGVFGCPGNHEYYSQIAEWSPVFKRLGLTMLHNGHQVVAPGGTPLIVAGLTDSTALDRRFNLPGPDLAAALAGAPEGPPVLLMEHRPGRARQNAQKAEILLQVSGHTHGGMMPILKTLVKRANQGFLAGWYDVDGLKLLVQPGVGLWSGFPMRLADPSEISLLTIRTASTK
ncbi:MAG: metallophosphoesterase [Deltaproteobacteria bacterium]|jgi:predicted MPP superfamily phosphohydrolase|nr:metallophosphoesterase [Deltaproteobacteria bacterium]